MCEKGKERKMDKQKKIKTTSKPASQSPDTISHLIYICTKFGRFWLEHFLRKL